MESMQQVAELKAFQRNALDLLRQFMKSDFRSEKQYIFQQEWIEKFLPLFTPKVGDEYFVAVAGGGGYIEGDLVWETCLVQSAGGEKQATALLAKRFAKQYGAPREGTPVMRATIVDALSDHPWYAIISCNHQEIVQLETQLQQASAEATQARLDKFAAIDRERGHNTVYMLAKLEKIAD